MTFAKESGFIFAMIGSAVGFANILAFSAQCYKNGGGAFLIPFLAAVLIIGLPMLFLEGIVGKRYGLPITSAYSQAMSNKFFKTFGWIAALSCLTIGSFYVVLTGWSVAYTYFSFANLIPVDTANFFQNEFLRDSGALNVVQGISLPIFFSTLLVFAIAWYVMSKNIAEGVEKSCSIFLPLLFILILAFSVAVIFLPGSSIGFYHYLNPDFSKLKNFQLWRDVFAHVFFSFSLGIGIVVGYSRHTKKQTNIKRAMIFVMLGDVIISVISGFAIFGCVGFMSQKTGVPFAEIVKSDSTFEMGFIIFPQILHIFPQAIARFVGASFFFCVFIAGITGVFSIIESVAGNIEVELGVSRKRAINYCLMLMVPMSLIFCLGNGVHIIGALAPMVMGNTFLIGGLAQVFVFLYKDKNIINDPIWLNRHQKKGLLFVCAKYVSFAFVAVSFIGALFEEFQEQWGLAHGVRWGWFALVLIFSLVAAARLGSKSKGLEQV